MMRNMTDFKSGHILLVPFPFTDFSATKKRPAVVVHAEGYCEARGDVIVAAITSRLLIQPAVGEFEITQWQDAGLLKPSAVKSVFATVHSGAVIQTLGILSEEDRSRLFHMLKRSIAGA